MRRLWIATAIVISLSACHKEAPKEVQRPPAEVTVVTVTPKDTPVTYEYVGQTQSSRQVQIVARVNGFLEKRVYTEGSVVKAGQVMFQQDPKPFQVQLDAAKAELAAQQARLQTARDDLARVKPLAARNALSQKDLDDATGREQAATAAVDAAKAHVEQARLNLSYTTITTPVTGVSSFAKVQDGQYVSATDNQLTYVAQLDPIWVNFSISENDILRLRGDEKAGLIKLPAQREYDIQLVLGDGTVYPQKGRITFTNADYDQKTGTFQARATLPNPNSSLRPGQFVRVRIGGAQRPNAILVPQEAVLQGARGHFVVVVDKDGKAQIRPVQVGPWHGNDWFINEGLKAGDVVIVEGVARVSPGAPVKIVEPKAKSGTSAAPGAAPAAKPAAAKP